MLVIIPVFLTIVTLVTTMGRLVVPDTTMDANSATTNTTSRTSNSSTEGTQNARKKWNGNKHLSANNTVYKLGSIATDTFKGVNSDICHKVFVVGPTQASKYDEAYKSLITYFGAKYGHRISRAFEQKYADVGRKMLVCPSPPMTTKVFQEASVGDNSTLIGKESSIVDRDGPAFITYQILLKQYLGDISKYNDDLEKCFGVIIG